jgi:3,4-dihydroxy 2-butanone 4-phosphate synthase/GTP cyclohydrolase II
MLIQAAELVSAQSIAFLVRHSSGFVRAGLAPEDSARLALPPGWWSPDMSREAQCVTVDAARGGTTGISAEDRARTLRLLADGGSRAEDFTRPGHVVPVRLPSDRHSSRRTPAQLALDLVTIAGLRPAIAYAELVSLEEPAQIASEREARGFGVLHGLLVVTCSELSSLEHLQMAAHSAS